MFRNSRRRRFRFRFCVPILRRLMLSPKEEGGGGRSRGACHDDSRSEGLHPAYRILVANGLSDFFVNDKLRNFKNCLVADVMSLILIRLTFNHYREELCPFQSCVP